jgi:hypothetical protein
LDVGYHIEIYFIAQHMAYFALEKKASSSVVGSVKWILVVNGFQISKSSGFQSVGQLVMSGDTFFFFFTTGSGATDTYWIVL